MYRNYDFVFFFPHEIMKIGYFCKIAEMFSTAGRSKTWSNLKFCFIKLAHRATYKMILYLGPFTSTRKFLREEAIVGFKFDKLP